MLLTTAAHEGAQDMIQVMCNDNTDNACKGQHLSSETSLTWGWLCMGVVHIELQHVKTQHPDSEKPRFDTLKLSKRTNVNKNRYYT